MSSTVIFLTTTGANNWTVPSDWNSSNNKIECIGGGGDGGSYPSYGLYAGGGGAYSKKNNIALTQGASIPYNVGANNGDTWFGNASYASAYVGAKGGVAGTNTYSPGGNASSGIGDVKYSGGAAGQYYFAGGAAGPNGNGGNGSWSSGWTGISGSADNGTVAGVSNTGAGTGNSGTEWDSTHGCGSGGTANSSGGSGFPGGKYGGGSGSGNNVSGSAGTQGIIVITYTPAPAPAATAGFLYLMV